MPTTNPSFIVQDSQTLVDICIESAGVIDGLFDCALENGIGITDDLIPGQEILGLIPDPSNASIVALFVNNPPSSGITPEQAIPGGIGNMQIQQNFIVS